MPAAITCSAALNPLLNVAVVEILLEKIVYGLELYEVDPNFHENLIATFKNQLTKMFDAYVAKYGTTSTIHDAFSNATSSSSSSSSRASGSRNRDPMLNLMNTLYNENSKRQRGNTPSSELGRYTGTNYMTGVDDFTSFDILGWWKGKESQFPVLAAMARDLLSVQASTVASESAFSVSGRVISIRRTRLTPVSVEMCICLKDHLDAAERIQHISSLEGENLVEGEIYEDEVTLGLTEPLTDEEAALDEYLQGGSGSGSGSSSDD